jgi:O-antigen/teichoic acid export membrane protein
LFYILKKSGINVAFIAKSYNLKLYREEFSEIYSFAMPLVLLAFFSWTVSQIDRYILYFYLSAKEVGSYTAAYGLGSKFFLLFVAPFLLLLKPLVFQIKKTGSTPLSGFKVTLKYWLLYFSISCLVEIFILLYYNSLGSIFLSEKYIEGFKVIPYISAGYLLLTSINFIEISFYAWNKTKYILFHYIFGAVTNIILNLLLVPRYGIIGSGISSFFSFSFQFLIASVLFAKLITKEKTFSQ